ncbi:hypothetical protein F2Q69_00044557 [Brassica cretica]|uniref:Uncharacterized protein n=1 Tax=Brassica cretica TaxID=69181 RepID=A0A8S9NFN8_BRACR|nr:hypothetical protein F2Q69_00044557 [Brassica cretica]
MKQLTLVMAPLVILSSPPHLCLPSPPSHLRPPPHPPPCTPPPLPLEALSPPKPPDPIDASFGPVFLLLFDTSFDPAQALSRTSDLESLLLNLAFVTGDGVISLVSIGDKVFASKCLYPAVCSLFLCSDLIMPLRKTATESASTIAVSLTRYTLPLRYLGASALSSVATIFCRYAWPLGMSY